jgi:hypothetical protein
VSLGGRELNCGGSQFSRQAALSKNGRLVIACLKVSVDLSSECTGAGKARKDMEPKTHGDKVAFVRCWTGRTIEKDPMPLKKLPNANLKLMKAAGSSNAKVATKGTTLGGRSESQVEGFLIGRKGVVVETVVVCVVHNQQRFVE